MPLGFIADALSGRTVVQGNLDPLLLVAGGDAMERRVAEILTALSGKPFIFNLGHGIVPQTPPENVANSWSWCAGMNVPESLPVGSLRTTASAHP